MLSWQVGQSWSALSNFGGYPTACSTSLGIQVDAIKFDEALKISDVWVRRQLTLEERELLLKGGALESLYFYIPKARMNSPPFNHQLVELIQMQATDADTHCTQGKSDLPRSSTYGGMSSSCPHNTNRQASSPTQWPNQTFAHVLFLTFTGPAAHPAAVFDETAIQVIFAFSLACLSTQHAT